MHLYGVWEQFDNSNWRSNQKQNSLRENIGDKF